MKYLGVEVEDTIERLDMARIGMIETTPDLINVALEQMAWMLSDLTVYRDKIAELRDLLEDKNRGYKYAKY